MILNSKVHNWTIWETSDNTWNYSDVLQKILNTVCLFKGILVKIKSGSITPVDPGYKWSNVSCTNEIK